jgi:hypothetical protein
MIPTVLMTDVIVCNEADKTCILIDVIIPSSIPVHVAINMDSECNQFDSYNLNTKNTDYESYMQMVHPYFKFTFTCILDEVLLIFLIGLGCILLFY